MVTDTSSKSVIETEDVHLTEEPLYWSSNIMDHFRKRHRYLSVNYERQYFVERWLHFKAFVCDRWFLPFWTPLFFLMTHISQRNRNLCLVENNLNYRPWKFRYNDWSNKY
ncbi:hypothetical protein XU18_0867 [Perkinsela sp. CCAP 1560/4]|nr:hypothetical protein XU18_0867 [Perkinsela sp. CCAP 1560/4]|eukprot:KNH08670.1 hypothetical protein XU18_0867 [Perkinsela sp. CCAP 1560/4]